jgi:hypothetical protein
MHDDTERELNTNTDDVQHLEQRPPYDDDGVLAEQTPGLDPESIRREAGPDWPADTQGDLEADTSPAGGSGTSGSDPGASSNR